MIELKCDRCKRKIKCGEIIGLEEMIFSIDLNMKSLGNNNSLRTNRSKTIASVCDNCSSLILAEEITLSEGLMPWLKETDDEDENEDWDDDISLMSQG